MKEDKEHKIYVHFMWELPAWTRLRSHVNSNTLVAVAQPDV